MLLNNGSTYLPNAGEGTVPLYHGMYAARVVNNADALGVGRLQLQIPQILGNSVSAWAVPLGTYYSIPDNGTTVSACFIGGDPSQPAWNGPVDLAPIVVAGTNATTYSASAPADPKVGDVWYETFEISGSTYYGPAQIWTFNSGTSTYSWVPVAQSGAGTNPVDIVAATISGSTFLGSNWIENSAGSFFYAGTPAMGNLLVTNAPTAGTDAYSNAYFEGLAVYSGANAINITGTGKIVWYTAPTQAGPWTVYSASSITQSDPTNYNVGGTSFAPITQAWPIAANDANAGTIYIVTTRGTGTVGSGGSPNNLLIKFSVFGANVITQFNTSSFSSGQVFSWEASCECIVQAAGSSGNVTVKVSSTVSANATLSATNTFSGVQVDNATSSNTTTSTTALVTAEWAGSNTGQNLLASASTYSRTGP